MPDQIEGSEQRWAPRRIRIPNYGQEVVIRIQPDTFAVPCLAAELADALVDVAPEISGSVQEIAVGIRSLCHHIGAGLRDASVSEDFGLKDLRVRHLDAWELDRLSLQRTDRTDTAYRHVVHTFNLLRRIDQDNPGLLDHTVRERLTRQVRLSHIRREGDPDHPPHEVRRIRSAAHRIVHSATTNGGDRGPSLDVLYALHVLLSLATGEPPEVIRSLRLRDVTATPVDGERGNNRGREDALPHLARNDLVRMYAVTWTKRRAGMKYDSVYDRDLNRAAFRALNAAISLTAPLRGEAPDDSLWIYRRDDLVSQFAWRDTRMSLGIWYDTHVGGAPIEGPHKFTRLRKVAIARQAADDPIRYLRDGRNHSNRTFFGHYFNSAVLRAEAGKLLVEAIGEKFDLAVAGPTVIPPEAERALEEGALTDQVDPDTFARLRDGQLDGALAACRDPEDSPFAAAGSICPMSRSGRCFTCPNAIVTADHLPELVAYERITDPEYAVNEQVWREVWKPIRDGVLAILPHFPPEMVEAARTRTSDVLSDLGVGNDLRGADG